MSLIEETIVLKDTKVNNLIFTFVSKIIYYLCKIID